MLETMGEKRDERCQQKSGERMTGKFFFFFREIKTQSRKEERMTKKKQEEKTTHESFA